MKKFCEWLESAELIRGWEGMPKYQKELIHYHRLSEKYGSELGQCKGLLEELLEELAKSFACRGIADRYGKRFNQMKVSFDANRVPGLLD